MRISLVILVKNELVGLKALFTKIPFDAVDEVIAVDGASTDGSVEFLLKNHIKTIVQTKTGRGEAFRLAFEHSTGDALIFFSPDGNEDPKDIALFRDYFESGADMVIGNRMSEGGHNEEDELWFPLRKWVNQAFTFFANTLWNRSHYVHDTINGFRGITRKAWAHLCPDGEGYVIEYQCSIRAFKKRMKIVEFPTYESKRIDERAGSPSFRTGVAFVRLFIRELQTEKRF